MAAEAVVRLHLNENPYGPGRRVRQALARAGADAHLYPDLGPLRRALASLWGVGPELVTVGAGGDDILRRAVDATAGPIVVPWPSFSVYRMLAEARGRTLVRVDLDGERRPDPEAIAAAAAAQGRPGTVLIANPNNPTGVGRRREELMAMAAAMPSWLVVIDEAYAEFRSPVEPMADVASWPPNAVVARTLSKLHGLAGLRVGYAVGPGWALRAVARMGDEMSVGTLAAAAAVAAVTDRARLKRVRAAILGRRERLAAGLSARGFRVAPSETNFLLVEPPPGLDALAWAEALRERGVRVRRGRDLGVEGALRVSVGSGPMQRRLFAAVDSVLAEVGAAAGHAQA